MARHGKGEVSVCTTSDEVIEIAERRRAIDQQKR